MSPAAVGEPLRPRDLPGLFKRTGELWLEQDGRAQASALAFNTLLSMAPLVLLILAAASRLLGTASARIHLVEAIAWVAGPEVAGPAGRVVETIADAGGTPLTTVLSVLLMVHFSSAVFAQLRGILNRIWGVRGRSGLRGALHERVVAWLFVPVTLVAFSIVILAGFALALATPLLSGQRLGVPWLVSAANAFVPFLLVSMMLAALYRWGPGAPVAWGDVWLGAGLAGLLLSVGNSLIGYLIGRNMLFSLYGAGGALVVTMLWVFYGAHLLLFGAYLSRACAERRAPRGGGARPGS